MTNVRRMNWLGLRNMLMITNCGVLGGRNHLDTLVFFNDEFLRVLRKCGVNSGQCSLGSKEIGSRFHVEDGEGSCSSFSSSIALVESQFGSSNMPTGWDRKTGLVLFLEVWLGSSLVVLGVEAAHSLEILIMSSCLN